LENHSCFPWKRNTGVFFPRELGLCLQDCNSTYHGCLALNSQTNWNKMQNAKLDLRLLNIPQTLSMAANKAISESYFTILIDTESLYFVMGVKCE
jgi:hypothetical protein